MKSILVVLLFIVYKAGYITSFSDIGSLSWGWIFMFALASFLDFFE